MSTIGGGSTSGYDNLSALLEFVKSPDYLERIRELRDQEAISRQTAVDATNATVKASAALSQLETERADLAVALKQFAADKATLDKRIALWDGAMIGVQKALRGED